MATPERHVLIAASVAGALPPDFRRGIVPAGCPACSIRVMPDILRETEALLGEKDGDHRLVLFLSPKEAAAISRLPAACQAAHRRLAAVIVETEASRDAREAPEVASEGPSLHQCVVGYRSTPPTVTELRFLLGRTWQTLDAWMREAEDAERRAAELSETSADLEALVRIGQSLSQEKDQERLLRTILSTSKTITGADAGSITLVEKDEQGNKRLRFKYSHTFSKELPFEERVMSYDTKSLSGYVAVTGRVLNLPDAYTLDPSLPYSFNLSFDKANGYRTRSVLVVPMRNHVDEVIGVIQLINCKEANPPFTGNEAYEIRLVTPEDYERLVVAFATRYESLMQAVASQAAIAIENNRMIAQIQGQFEQFVRASVTAIDSRDPPTSGHSVRVAQMCLNTARAINDTHDGPLAEVTFSDHALREIELAGLLHDFGKVYIDARVFLKAKKLFPADYAYLMLRLEYIHRTIELAGARAADPVASEATRARLEALRSVMETVKRLNEPTVLSEDPGALIKGIQEQGAGLAAADVAGNSLPLLTPAEAENLSIGKGTLNNEERLVIQSHVEHTYNFVEKIPWPAEFAAIPRIARGHHEKLDGTGYPDGLKGKEAIPIQARIMAIADIYDALAATDRPYKKAVPRDRVFKILREEATSGKLDTDIVELFISRETFNVPRADAAGAP